MFSLFYGLLYMDTCMYGNLIYEGETIKIYYPQCTYSGSYIIRQARDFRLYIK